MNHQPVPTVRKALIPWIGALLWMLAGPALAELPTMEPPSRGEGDGMMTTIQNYAYDFGIFAGLVISAVAFYTVAGVTIRKFKDANENKGSWGEFGLAAGVGVILIVVIIWLMTQAAEIL